MTTTTTTPEVPFLDVTAPGFSITSAEVHEAREQSWYARTPYGIAVLRYDEMNRLIKHPKLRQGSVAWPAHNGITEGPFARWWASWLLNKEGDEHHRLRRLMNPAFSPKLIESLVLRFQRFRVLLSLSGAIEDFAGEHRQIIEAFREADAARAERLVRGNARHGEEELVRRLAAAGDLG